MLFWLCALVLTCLVAALVLRPILAPSDEGAGGVSDVDIYKDQLAEVDRDLARGVLAQEEAERTRTEIARRLLAADAQGVAKLTSGPKRSLTLVFLVFALLTVGGGGGYYLLGAPGYPDTPRAARIAAGDAMRENRPSQAESEAAMPVTQDPDVTPEYAAMLAQLREIVPTRPDDLQGWTLLARHEAALGQYIAAAHAQSRVVALLGDNATEEDLTVLADLMVGATGGLVSPQAETVIRKILASNAENVAARYYLGLLYAQTDRPDIAFRLWRSVIESDAESFHVTLARGQIENAAFLAGVDYSLPPERGPSVEDIANAADMSAEDREAMIAGMVAQLSDRLATEGGTPEEWARLIRAHGVLGNTEDASAIWAEAQIVFAASPGAVALIEAAAKDAGVAQ